MTLSNDPASSISQMYRWRTFTCGNIFSNTFLDVSEILRWISRSSFLLILSVTTPNFLHAPQSWCAKTHISLMSCRVTPIFKLSWRVCVHASGQSPWVKHRSAPAIDIRSWLSLWPMFSMYERMTPWQR